MHTHDRLQLAMEAIKRLEVALFKVACGQVGDVVLSRADMLDIAEEVLPTALQAEVLKRGKVAHRKGKKPTNEDWYYRNQGRFE